MADALANRRIGAIDTCYTHGAHRRVLGFEDLQADDGDPDSEVGVEEQFVTLSHAYADGGPSLPATPWASEDHLLDVLESACLRGMAPRHLERGTLPAARRGCCSSRPRHPAAPAARRGCCSSRPSWLAIVRH